jgi:hypothetical protein
VHLGPATPLTIRTETSELPGAAFEPDDPDLEGQVLLDWDAFTEWLEEDEPVIGHPHDPFDRIDCRRSSRRVVVSHDGHVLADTTRATSRGPMRSHSSTRSPSATRSPSSTSDST